MKNLIIPILCAISISGWIGLIIAEGLVDSKSVSLFKGISSLLAQIPMVIVVIAYTIAMLLGRSL